MVKLFANSGDPDQTPRSAASDQGLHCLPITLLRVSQLQWVNILVTVLADHFFSNSLNISLSKKIHIHTLNGLHRSSTIKFLLLLFFSTCPKDGSMSRRNTYCA